MSHRTSQVHSALAAACFALVTACSSDSAVAPDGTLTVYKIAGDRQIGIAGLQLSRALHIQIWSATRQVADAAFSVEVTGGGSVDVATARTDHNGNAMIRWTLGNESGENRLTVTVPGAEPQTFTATAVAVAPENLYYYNTTIGQQHVIGLNAHDKFVAVDPGGCSNEGEYDISGSRITFSVHSAEPSTCAALPALTGLIDDVAIVFEVVYYDYYDRPFSEALTYWKNAPLGGAP